MKINEDTITHVANLARLSLTKDEKQRLTLDMENILSFVDKLNELDTKDIEATAHVLPLKNVFREDDLKSSYPRESILKNAPCEENGCFKVPKIME